MKVRSITVHQVIGNNPPKTSSFLFNDECQLIIEDREGKHIEHRYLPDGNEYERIVIDNGTSTKTRFEYDDEGDLLEEVETDEVGNLLSKTAHNWIKPERVESVETIEYEEGKQSHSFSRSYYLKDGRHRFTRSDDYCLVSEYDEHGTLRCEKAGFDLGNGQDTRWANINRYNDDGLIIEHIDEDGTPATLEYQYDEYENWIRAEGRINGGPVSMVMERIIEYIPGRWTGEESVYGVFGMYHITKKLDFKNR